MKGCLESRVVSEQIINTKIYKMLLCRLLRVYCETSGLSKKNKKEPNPKDRGGRSRLRRSLFE